MEYYKAGEQITLTIERQTENGGYEEMDVTLTLGNRPDSESTSSDQEAATPATAAETAARMSAPSSRCSRSFLTDTKADREF